MSDGDEFGLVAERYEGLPVLKPDRARGAEARYADAHKLSAGLMLSTPAPADASGCTLLLCTSPGAPPWQSIPECVQPVMTAYWMADHGMGWPQCPEAAGSQSSIGAPVRRVGVWATKP